MNVNLERGTNASRLLNLCKRACLLSIIAVLIAGCFILPASAAYIDDLDTSGWVDLDCDFHIYWADELDSSEYFAELVVVPGMNDYTYMSNPWYAMAFTSGVPIYKDCTYRLTYTFKTLRFSRDLTNFVFTEKLPEKVSDLAEQRNSAGIPYIDLVDIRSVYVSGVVTEYIITFSTAEGYLDNTLLGDCFASLLCTYEGEGEVYRSFQLTSMSSEVIFDPSADYYLELTKERQNKLVDLTIDSVTTMKDSLSQIPLIDNMSDAVDYVSGTIGKAASLVSPVATLAEDGGVNIYPAFGLFSNIYNSVMGSVDPALLAVVATVPLLCFLAWLFSSLFKSLL